jgi:predicted acetyltransferase
MELTTRPITADETVRFREAVVAGFGEDLDDEEFPPEWFADLIPLDRTVGAFDGDRIVGTLAGIPFEVTVPGGAQIPMAGTTVATVAPTHRRRGALSAMMRDHLDDGRRRREPLAGLWASESLIYRRFGFGVATEHDETEIDQLRVSVEGDAGLVRLVSVDEALTLFPRIYDEERRWRPGMLSRSEKWWEHHFRDPSVGRRGFSALRLVAHETNGAADGYALYRQKADWESGFPNGTISVRELITSTPSAHTGLWKFLTSIDLFPKIKYWNLPVDDPLRWKVPDHRRVQRERWDALYLRILDVPQALEARTYGADGTLTCTVADSFLPDAGGSFELVVTGGVGACRRIDTAVADLQLDTSDLASLYLGGHGAAALAEAGRITAAGDAVILAGRMFRGDVEPWCEEVF